MYVVNNSIYQVQNSEHVKVYVLRNILHGNGFIFASNNITGRHSENMNYVLQYIKYFLSLSYFNLLLIVLFVSYLIIFMMTFVIRYSLLLLFLFLGTDHCCTIRSFQNRHIKAVIVVNSVPYLAVVSLLYPPSPSVYNISKYCLQNQNVYLFWVLTRF